MLILVLEQQGSYISLLPEELAWLLQTKARSEHCLMAQLHIDHNTRSSSHLVQLARSAGPCVQFAHFSVREVPGFLQYDNVFAPTSCDSVIASSQLPSLHPKLSASERQTILSVL